MKEDSFGFVIISGGEVDRHDLQPPLVRNMVLGLELSRSSKEKALSSRTKIPAGFAV